MEVAVEEKGVGLSPKEEERADFESHPVKLSGQLGTHKGVWAKGARKVRDWEEKVNHLKGHGETARMWWAESCVEKAKKKLGEKYKAMVELQSSVERLEGWGALCRGRGGREEEKEGDGSGVNGGAGGEEGGGGGERGGGKTGSRTS